MRLVELNPQYEPPSALGAPDRITFVCPKCRKGVVLVWLKEGEPKSPLHGCNKLPPNFETLTVQPSIASEGQCRHCPGWHGFITNGEVQ